MSTRVLNHVTPLNCLKSFFPNTRIYSNLPLKIFGCNVFVHLPSIFRSKLDPRAEKCIFVGYAPHKKGFNCFNPITRKYFVSTDVTFIESRPYFQKKIPRKEKDDKQNFWQTSPTAFLPIHIVSHESNLNVDIFDQGNDIPKTRKLVPSPNQQQSNPELLVYSRKKFIKEIKNLLLQPSMANQRTRAMTP